MKNIPIRKCLATNKSFPKNELIRIVKTPNGEVKIDLSGKLNGRGAYLYKSKEAIEIAFKKKVLSKALECEIDESLYSELMKLL